MGLKMLDKRADNMNIRSFATGGTDRVYTGTGVSGKAAREATTMDAKR